MATVLEFTKIVRKVLRKPTVNRYLVPVYTNKYPACRTVKISDNLDENACKEISDALTQAGCEGFSIKKHESKNCYGYPQTSTIVRIPN